MDADKIALFDMDGTLADYEARLRRDLARLRSPNDPPVRLSWDVLDTWEEARMDLIKSQVGWWEDLSEIPSGFLILHLAKKVGFNTQILTKGPRRLPNAWGEKLRWCQKHIAPDVDITITQDKGIVWGRVLCDDFPEYMDRWLAHRPRGLGLMPMTEYNKTYDHPRVIHYPVDLTCEHPLCEDIFEALTAAFNR
jgi:phosphoglycolate phosphatase-like HAD superfamily hydrolase